jgi:hypothetical protein
MDKSDAMYTFQEILNFNLDTYMPHIGWVGNKPLKIYSQDGLQNYFLHDERSDRLFEFSTGGDRLKSREDCDRVVSQYLGKVD